MPWTLKAWNLVVRFLTKFSKNDTLQQFVRLSLAEQKMLLSGLASHSLEQGREEDEKGSVYISWRYFFQGIRQFFQLPCSFASRLKRADWIESNFAKDTKVLLLGDDDLLTPEMAQREFTHITAADCDPKVLAFLREGTADLRYRPQIVQGNFLDKNFLNEADAEVICIDPPYNLTWSLTFIDQALRSAGTKADVSIMIMINPDCFARDDLNHIWSKLEAQGYQLKERHPRFNSYPLYGISSFFLRLGIRILLGEKFKAPSRKMYFSSDLFVFSRGSHISKDKRKALCG